MVSGAEISLEVLVRNIDTNRYNVKVALPSKKGQFHHRLIKNNVDVIGLPILRLKKSYNPLVWMHYMLSWFACNFLLFIILKKHKIDIVHANTTTAYLYVFFTSKLAGKPCIWHIRDKVPSKYMTGMLACFSSHIFCISKFVVPIAISGSNKYSILYNAVELSLTDQGKNMNKLHERLGIPSEMMLIAHIGQFIPWKNHADLVLTAEQVIKHNKNVRFLFIGADKFNEYQNYKKYIENLIKEKELNNYFYILGDIADINEVLPEIDVLFHPAVTEPFGRVIIECMAFGVPVIAINVGGPAEIVQNNVSGYLIEPHDINDMSEKIKILLENAALRMAMGIEGRMIIGSRFTIQKQIEIVENIYQQQFI